MHLYQTKTCEVEVGATGNCLFIYDWRKKHVNGRLSSVTSYHYTREVGTRDTAHLATLPKKAREAIRDWCERKAAELGYINTVEV